MNYQRLTHRELLRIARSDDVEARLRAVIEIDRRKKEMPHSAPDDGWTRRGVFVSVIIALLTVAATILVPVYLEDIRSFVRQRRPSPSTHGSLLNHTERQAASSANSAANQEPTSVSKLSAEPRRLQPEINERPVRTPAKSPPSV